MTRLSGLPIRPALMLFIALAATAFILLSAQHSTEAGGANSLAISPTDREIGAGATASVELVSMPPVDSLGAWVIDVTYDPAVVSVNSCTPISIPAGAVGISHCEADDQEGGPDDETVVSVGGVIFPDTELGLEGESTLTTITFMAVGNVDDCSDLTINVVSHLGPDPDGDETNPDVTNGEICIVEDAGTDRIWGDSDCSDAVNPIDSLKVLRYDAALSVSQAAGCPDIASNVTVDGTARMWNDVDCNGGVNPVDSLKTLRYDAQLSVSQEPGCPEIGDTVSVS